MSGDRILLEQIQLNRRTLDGCAVHRFSVTEVKIGQRLTCDRCHGTMSLTDIGNYIRGYVAAGRYAADVWPAWEKGKRK